MCSRYASFGCVLSGRKEEIIPVVCPKFFIAVNWLLVRQKMETLCTHVKGYDLGELISQFFQEIFKANITNKGRYHKHRNNSVICEQSSFNNMNLIVVLESSIVIYTVHMANVAHEWMNSCHVITQVIMVAEHFFTPTTFMNITAVGWAIVILTVLARDDPACFCTWWYSKGSHRTPCSILFRSSLNVGGTSGGQLGKSMLHPLVLPQPLFRDGFEVTLITRRHTGSNSHFFNVIHCWMV